MENTDLYKGIFEHAPIAHILTNSEGFILEANNHAAQLLGYNKAELTNVYIGQLFPFKPIGEDLTEKKTFTSFNDIVDAATLTQEFLVQKKENSQFFAQLHLSYYEPESTRIFIWTIKPTQQEKTLLYELKERIKEQQALLNVTEILFKHDNASRALNKCIPYIKNAWQFPEYTVVRVKLIDGSGYVTDGFKQTPWGFFSTIESNQQVYGTIEVYYTQEIRAYGGIQFLKEEKRLIDSLAKLFGIFLANLHTIKKLQDSERKITKITNQIPANTYQFEILADGNVKVHFASKGLNEFIYDYTSQDLVHTPNKVIDLIIDEDRKLFFQTMKKAYHDHNPINIQYRTLHNDTVRWRWFRATPEFRDNNEIVWYGSSQDVTPFIDHIDVLEQILSDISHFMRRPVASMLGLTDLIDHSNMNAHTVKDISTKLKVVASEMDDYIHQLNNTYNEKILNTSAEKIGFTPYRKRDRN